ncbi:MAG: YsnF/AvaK domain-containing protein [Geodermatophilaceae bacterium]
MSEPSRWRPAAPGCASTSQPAPSRCRCRSPARKSALEREPITDANRDAATTGADLSEEEHEVILTEERPVVQKETVPVERVRLDKDTVTDTAQVSEEVRCGADRRRRRPERPRRRETTR